jgi:UDP:flavonoid glycosyltransferase YjiC (YdhE family)
MLISPICNDQFHQAHFIRRSSTGIELNLYQAGKVEIQDALNQLLCDAVIASNVRRVAKSYAVDGAMRAGELIAQVP